MLAGHLRAKKEEVMLMAQFLWDVLAGFTAAVLAALVLNLIKRH